MQCGLVLHVRSIDDASTNLRSNLRSNLRIFLQHSIRSDKSCFAGQYEPLPCNAFSFCMPEEGESCFEPDAHKHTKVSFLFTPAATAARNGGSAIARMHA